MMEGLTFYRLIPAPADAPAWRYILPAWARARALARATGRRVRILADIYGGTAARELAVYPDGSLVTWDPVTGERYLRPGRPGLERERETAAIAIEAIGGERLPAAGEPLSGWDQLAEILPGGALDFGPALAEAWGDRPDPAAGLPDPRARALARLATLRAALADAPGDDLPLPLFREGIRALAARIRRLPPGDYRRWLPWY